MSQQRPSQRPPGETDFSRASRRSQVSVHRLQQEPSEAMGMRPRMHLVFGVDDFRGDIHSEICETRLHITDTELKQLYANNFLKDAFYDHKTQEWGYIGGFLYHEAEFNPGVIGMSINQSGYDSDLIRALSVFHPEYYKAGKRDIPVWDTTEHSLYAKRITDSKWSRCADIEFQWSWFYPSMIEQHNVWPVHAYCTRWLLQQVGVSIDYHRYKAMLVWQWS